MWVGTHNLERNTLKSRVYESLGFMNHKLWSNGKCNSLMCVNPRPSVTFGVSDVYAFIMMTVWTCWWHNHCVGDFFNVISRSTSSQIRHQYLKLVSNIRHQHRFNIWLCRIVVFPHSRIPWTKWRTKFEPKFSNKLFFRFIFSMNTFEIVIFSTLRKYEAITSMIRLSGTQGKK